jgi:beta-N-acetylhexosaminidase
MSFSLREKIAQMLCFGFNGSIWSDELELKDWLKNSDGLGWLIEFDYDCHQKTYPKNIESLPQVKQLNQSIKMFYASLHPQKPPIMISVDVEGGKVDRLARCKDYPLLPSAEEIAALAPVERQKIWDSSAKLLKELGFDLNFAPVVDLNLSPTLGIFGPLRRCFASSPEQVSLLAKEYIQVLNRRGLIACLKHFPGHGSAKGDSHEGFVDVSTSFQSDELIPYENLIRESGLVECIMTAHVINKNLDSSGRPATLSKPILTDLLRNQMNYQGLIISDDLQMYAISKYFTRKEALKLSIEAGADILMFCNQLGWDNPSVVIDDIESLVKTQEISEEFIDRAFLRIQHYKNLRCQEHAQTKPIGCNSFSG